MILTLFCGGGWTRTTELIRGQIYSLLQLPLCDSPPALPRTNIPTDSYHINSNYGYLRPNFLKNSKKPYKNHIKKTLFAALN